MSHEEEESRLATLIAESGLPDAEVIKKHLSDAVQQYLDGTKDHSSLNESRSVLQALINAVCEEIKRTGKSKVGLPGNMDGRLNYLEQNAIFTSDDRMAFGAAWGFLSAGAHPGLPSRDQARIGMILSLEFSQVLIMKWQHWQRQNS